MNEQESYGDFEFERRFYCDKTLREIEEKYDVASAQIIIQNYFASKDGYSLRIRVTCGLQNDDETRAYIERTLNGELTSESEERFIDELIERQSGEDFLKKSVLHATCTVKGSSTGGTRYECENPIDTDAALHLLKAGQNRITKIRSSVWIDGDGWEIDSFCGKNSPLVIAECERTSPVTDLKIPSFCVSEVTDEVKFSNDHLSRKPFSEWKDEYLEELCKSGGRFSDEFGENIFLD